jgi:RTA1 like protein
MVLQLGSVFFCHICPMGALLTRVVVFMTLYFAIAVDFVVKFNSDRPAFENDVSPSPGAMDLPIRRMLFAMFIVTILLYIRAIYRVVGLSQGFGGKVISTEWLFGSSARHSLCLDTRRLMVIQLYLMAAWLYRRCLRSSCSTPVHCWSDRTKLWRMSGQSST